MKAAITAPDPDISDNARDYFVRCMRLLEHCTPSWPMESMRKQIDALREAFSADTGKPFELKSAFPFGSPLSQPSELPIVSTSSYRQSQVHQVPLDPSSQVSHTSAYPLTPPISNVGEDFKTNSPVPQPIGLLIHQTPAAPTPLQTNNVQSPWNPSRIFELVFNSRILKLHLTVTANGILRFTTLLVPLRRIIRQQFHMSPHQVNMIFLLKISLKPPILHNHTHRKLDMDL
jgi:hypothetical protein